MTTSAIASTSVNTLEFDVFVSHSTNDDKTADIIHEALSVRELRIWMDHKCLAPGSNFDETINTQLRLCPYFLLLVSKSSLMSREVGGEWRTAINNDKKILLIIIDDTAYKDLPATLSNIQAINFYNNWDEGIQELITFFNPASD
ncbi:MAG TPA: toll/interleukin-1 receptor domain-containing protein, partial [Phototrophicaceae bacterium]|nr:toll/interleukin-1 receptor domain-containing protein [Phototrophicaceae bacterium]